MSFEAEESVFIFLSRRFVFLSVFVSSSCQLGVQ